MEKKIQPQLLVVNNRCCCKKICGPIIGGNARIRVTEGAEGVLDVVRGVSQGDPLPELSLRGALEDQGYRWGSRAVQPSPLHPRDFLQCGVLSPGTDRASLRHVQAREAGVPGVRVGACGSAGTVEVSTEELGEY